jgi:HEXXH motif-containing protein
VTATAPRTEVSPDLLWQGVEVFEALHRKSAATLLALERALSRRPTLAAEERAFLAAHAAARAYGDAAFARVWTVPAACAFAHRAYDLLRARQAGEPDAERWLWAHLDGFQLFTLGAALLAGAELRLARPLAVPRPVAIPGSPLVLRGRGPLLLHGLRGGALEISLPDAAASERLHPGGAALGATLAPAPLAVHAGAQIQVGAELFELPGVDPGEAFAAVPPDPAWGHARASQLADALAVIERRQPALFAQMRATLRGVALKPRRAGGFQGMTFSDFPGASIVSFSPQPHVLADGLIHEFYHNRLFAIESGLPLVEVGADARLHASPFRPDPRPVRGLLHGLYVFVAVWRFWDQVRRDPGLDPLLSAFAVDRVLRIALNLVIGRRQLAAAQGELTEAGRAVLALLSAEVEHAVAEIERAALPLGSPAAFCEEDGRIRLETSRDGAPLTVADALGRQLRRFAPSSPSAPGS